jgi:hypothetical protein
MEEGEWRVSDRNRPVIRCQSLSDGDLGREHLEKSCPPLCDRAKGKLSKAHDNFPCLKFIFDIQILAYFACGFSLFRERQTTILQVGS